MNLLRKYGRVLGLSLFLAGGFGAAASAAPAGAASAAAAGGGASAAAGADIEAVKKALLDDPLFLSHLRDKISSDSMNSDIIRQYLLQNPDILMEMQEALAAKSNGQAQSSAEQVKILQENEQLLYHSANDSILGDKNAKIALLEFYDYNCSYCKRAFPEEQKFIAAHKNVKIIMKDYPILGEDSVAAHIIAHAVKKLAPEKYAPFHEKLMLLRGRATEASALAAAASLGLDKAALRREMQNPDVQEDTLASARIAYKLGLNYTPVFVLGTKILGAADVKSLAQIIAEETKQTAKAK